MDTNIVARSKFNFLDQSLVNINILQNNVRYSRYNRHVTALYSRRILNKRTVERV